MSAQYLVKCTTFSPDWRFCCIPPNVGGSEKASCGLALVAIKRNGCDVWQMECHASNVTANVQSDHLLHGYMLPVFSPLINCIVHHAVLKFSPCRNKTLHNSSVSRIGTRYAWKMKKMKKCAFYKVVRWHFSGVVGKGVTACFLLRQRK